MTAMSAGAGSNRVDRVRVNAGEGRSSRGERVTLFAADGYPIVARRYAPPGPTRAHLIVAGATGVPQRFYRRFAEFATTCGFETMRGSGRPLYVIGHSYGGHAFGFLPSHAHVRAFYTFGTGAGWHGWMPRRERLRVLALWHVIGPVATRWHGYAPLRRYGLGEDLPLDFYRQWRQWCRFPNFFFGDPSMHHVAQGFARVRTRMMAANATDDRWSPPASRDAFISGYRNAPRETLDIDPAGVGLPAIGHMGYFRAGAVPLWDSALTWLDAQ